MVITLFLVIYVICLGLVIYRFMVPNSKYASVLNNELINSFILFILVIGTARYAWDLAVKQKKISIIFFMMAAIFYGVLSFCESNRVCVGLQSIAKSLVTVILVVFGFTFLLFGS